MVIGSPKFQKVSDSASLLPMTIVIYKNVVPFSIFLDIPENKNVQISEITSTQHFQKCFTDYDRATWALQKSA